MLQIVRCAAPLFSFAYSCYKGLSAQILDSSPCGFELGAAHRTICSVLKTEDRKVQRTEPQDKS